MALIGGVIIMLREIRDGQVPIAMVSSARLLWNELPIDDNELHNSTVVFVWNEQMNS